MIKNDIQLRRARERLNSITDLIEQYSNLFDGNERDILILPLLDEEQEIRNEIEEYTQLKAFTFEEALRGPLSKPSLIDDIGELLAKLRIASKLTQQELAERLGWEQPNLSRFESENYSSQTISKTVEFATELGIRLYIKPSLSEYEDISVKIDLIKFDFHRLRLATTSDVYTELFEWQDDIGTASHLKILPNLRELTTA